MHTREWYLVTLLICAYIFTGCDNKQKEALEIDDKLTALYDRGCDISDSVKFTSEFESALSNSATFLFSLDSLSTRMKIKKYDGIKSYEPAMPICTKVGESLVIQTVDDCIYIQCLGENKNSLWLKIDQDKEENKAYRSKEWIRDIYTINEQKKKYYVVVTFFYNEDDELLQGEDSGGMMRVYHINGNRLVKTNELFPSANMFDQHLSLRMDNFEFDTNTNTVSYDEYGYTPGVDEDMKVIGRIEWQLKHY